VELVFPKSSSVLCGLRRSLRWLYDIQIPAEELEILIIA